MRRSYGPGEYLDACRRARAALPDLNLTTDAIVGFPGEDERAFQATVDVVEDLAMGKVHVFPYSPRPGTVAAAMEGRPDPEELKARAKRLRDVSDRLAFAHRRRRVGSADAVLIETRHEDGTLTGLGRDYSRFVLPPGAGAPGDLVPVVVAGVAGEHLDGRPLTAEAAA
jgi:threonylcarbamoyladenosine tRNA methylthiotransferase MtaB